MGVETLLVGAGNRVYQIPLTYRGAPLEGAQAFLVGTMKHSVLGDRWVYDATADPVYVGELAAALLAGKPQAVKTRETDGKIETLPDTAELFSTGTSGTQIPTPEIAAPTTAHGIVNIPVGALTLSVVRELDLAGVVPAKKALGVTWAGRKPLFWLLLFRSLVGVAVTEPQGNAEDDGGHEDREQDPR
ncbi:maltokinase N-terminal cap-like domain-containing protein [Arthrobacter alpinus]|uniref:maltokinase N-terminal cap-like domain-containing protein n=1 Tax=Arthrobacter alpinus TaxID=656366 RepID=UPI0007819CFD|nr:hypothetical protein [Arthrobacter alpinus]